MNKYLEKIIKTKLVQVPIAISKRVFIPGFDGLPIYDVIRFFVTGILKNSLTTRASSLAFRFFLALFPSIIFLFALIPYIPIDNFQEQLLEVIKNILPKNAYELSSSTISELITNKSNSLLSFGFLFAFYLASNGVNSMIIAFNDSYHSSKKGSFIKTRLRSLLILIILTTLMIAAIGLIVFSEVTLDFLMAKGYLNNFSIYAVKIAKFIVLLLIFFLCISSIYYFGNVRHNKFRFISAGSTLATLLSILLSTGFAYYVNNFATYNKVYGSIGTLIVVMLWLYFNSLVLLIGFELNASIGHAREIKNGK